jgi:hypothetical protein
VDSQGFFVFQALVIERKESIVNEITQNLMLLDPEGQRKVLLYVRFWVWVRPWLLRAAALLIVLAGGMLAAGQTGVFPLMLLALASMAAGLYVPVVSCSLYKFLIYMPF